MTISDYGMVGELYLSHVTMRKVHLSNGSASFAFWNVCSGYGFYIFGYTLVELGFLVLLPIKELFTYTDTLVTIGCSATKFYLCVALWAVIVILITAVIKDISESL